jgi:hypothetical protein
LEQREDAACASVEKAARPLLARLEPQLLGVERPCPLQILGWQSGGDTTVFEHRQSFRLVAPFELKLRRDRVSHEFPDLPAVSMLGEPIQVSSMGRS